MFGWFAKEKTAARELKPEARWLGALTGDEVKITDPEGVVTSVLLSDLTGVVIETNDSGPWGADFWWLLFGPNDRVACAFPQGATGEQTIVDRLTSLPSFDFVQMTAAMRSTENATFPVWRQQIVEPPFA